MTDLARLTVRLEADNARLQRDLDKAQAQVNKYKVSASAAFSKVGAAVGVAAGTAAVGLALLVKRQIDAADQFSLLAQKTGLTTEALSQLDYAAKQSGIEDLTTGLVKFNKSISEAAQGSKTQADAFKSLGISVKDANGNIKTTEDLLNEAADALSKYRDGANKTAIVLDLFGKSGAELIPLLNEGSDGIRKFREEADKLGLTISTETAQAANDFNDSLDKLSFAVAGVGRKLVTDLSKPMQEFADFMSEPETIASIAAFGEALVKSLGAAATTVVALTSGVQRLYGFLAQDPKELVGVLARIAKLQDELKDSETDEGGFDFLNDLSPQRIEEVKKELAGLIALRDKLFAQQREAINTPGVAHPGRPDVNRIDSTKQTKEETEAERQLNAELEARISILDEIERMQTEAADAQSRQNDLGLQAADEIDAEIARIEELGGVLEDLSNQQLVFANNFGGAFAAYSEEIKNVSATIGGDLVSALDAAIYRTADLAANTLLWGEGGEEALKALGRSIITDVVSSLIKVGLQMAANAALQATLGTTMAAATTAYASAATAAWTPAAIGASIATLGGAGPIGLSSYLTALATGEAAALSSSGLGGFAEGGFTGAGPLNEVAGVVHRREAVLSADALSAAANAMNDPSFWTVSRNASLSGNGAQIVVNNNAPGVNVTAFGNMLSVDMIPELLELVDSDQAARSSSGLGRNFQKLTTKFGAQQRADR